MDFQKEYYTILEISKNATKEEIKASYRRLAMQFHPDKNAGSPAAEEKFKIINEANEVLSNDILRHEYDEYKRIEAEWKSKQEQDANSQQASSGNKRTYQKTNTYTKEKRVYIQGQIIIKYWADQEEHSTETFQTEFSFKINPTDVQVIIVETDIHPPNQISNDYLKSFKESEIFKTPLSQPIKCTINTIQGEEHYELELKDIRIKNTKLEGVTKHEGQSFGTLTADVYAYTPKVETFTEMVDVTECFGETGNLETKKEGENAYFRKEYYHPDCSTYWGSWTLIKSPREKVRRTGPKAHTSLRTQTGTHFLQWWWIPLLLLFIIAFPHLLIGFLIIGIITLLFYFGGRVIFLFSRLLAVLAALFFALLIIFAIRSFSGNQSNIIKHDTPSFDTLKTTKTVIPRTNNSHSSQTAKDSLINHFIRWSDYDSTAYEANLAVMVSEVNTAIGRHNQLEPVFSSTNTLGPVYNSMIEQDETSLQYVYNTFDSVRIRYNLNETNFAKMVVSCIQSIPYFLVLDRNCTDKYDDEFTNNYLSTCDRDCCIGNEKFGVRSPVEFMSDLKGDCDTRALFLYQIFKKFNYNVALLTSNYYKHAMIAVHFDSYEPNGLAINFHDKNFYLWETTSAGFDVGIIPPYLQDLSFWKISLINEK